MQTIEQAANQAVFQLQLNTETAVRYVVKNTGANYKQAQAVIREVVVFHRANKVKGA